LPARAVTVAQFVSAPLGDGDGVDAHDTMGDFARLSGSAASVLPALQWSAQN
jgi:hypothetical protein